MKPSSALCRWLTTAAVAAVILSAGNLPGQDQPSNQVRRSELVPTKFNLEIVDGNLILPKGEPSTAGARVPMKRATIANIADFIRANDPSLNIIVTPQAATLTIQDLKLRSVDLKTLFEGLVMATDGKLQGRPFGSADGRNNNVVFTTATAGERRMMEVFNLTAHLRQYPDKAAVEKGLQEIQFMIVNTLETLQEPPVDRVAAPDFQFHEGTGLLVVIGTEQALEVARKIVQALPGVSRSSRNAAAAPTDFSEVLANMKAALNSEMETLAEMKARFPEQHRSVQAQQARVDALKARIETFRNSLVHPPEEDANPRR